MDPARPWLPEKPAPPPAVSGVSLHPRPPCVGRLLLSYFCPAFESPLTLVERFVAPLLDEKLLEDRTACCTHRA